MGLRVVKNRTRDPQRVLSKLSLMLVYRTGEAELTRICASVL